jgi:hypothetical protein
LLKHKLDIEASLILAKKHLNFDCKKNEVDEINSILWDLREMFLLLKENPKVTSFPMAFESSTSVHLNTFIIPNVQSNHVSMVTEPIEKMQQLSSSRILSSNKDFSSEDAIFKVRSSMFHLCAMMHFVINWKQ